MDKKMMSMIAVIAVVAVVVVAAVAVMGTGNKGDTEYTLTYESNGGSEIADVKFTKNTEIVLATPTKDNATFLGWYDNSALNGSAITKIVKGTEKNVTVYAKWQLNLISIPSAGDFANNSNVTTTFTSSTPASEKVVSTATIGAITAGKTLTVEEKVGDKVTFSWTFNGATSTNAGYDSSKAVSTAVTPSVDSENKKVTLAFDYEGKLPYASTIKAYVGDDFAPGTQVSVQNENDSEAIGVYTVDANGYIEFTIDHCSDWNLTYYVQFTFDGCQGTFADGSSSKVIGGDYKSVVPAAPVPTRAGYELDPVNPWSEAIPSKFIESKTFYANWVPITYSVAFNSNGGSVVPVAYFTVESGIQSFGEPTKDYCTFAGWYDNAELTGTPVTGVPVGHIGNIQLYAKWVPTEYTLTYNTMGGSAIPSQTFTVESEAIILSVNTGREAYTFAGWYDNQAYAGDAITQIAAGSHGDITVYAKWTPVEYTLTYNTNGGSSVASRTFTVETATFDLAAGPVKDGYAFGGWYSDENLTNSVTQIEQGTIGDRTVYAKWGPNNVTLSTTLDGTSHSVGTIAAKIGAQSVSMTEKAAGLYYLETSPNFPIVEGDSVQFYLDNAVVASATVVNGVGSATASFFTVEFKSQGQTLNSTVVIAGEHVAAPGNDPSRAGYAFAGWKTAAGVDFDFENTAINARTEIITGWNVTTYNVSFEVNGGSAVAQHSFTVETATFQLTETSAKTGYTFAGWYGNAECTGDAVTQVAQGTVGDITVYAKWTPVQYYITFHANNGQEFNPLPYTIESAVTIDLAPTKDGYTFAGWYDNIGLTGDAVTGYPAGTTGAKDLYAKWTPTQYTITFATNGGSAVDSINYTIETATFALPSTTTKAGFAFAGWYDNETLRGDAVTQIVIGTTGDMTLYAKWNAYQISVKFYLDGYDSDSYYNIGNDIVTVKTQDEAREITLIKTSVGCYKVTSSDAFPVEAGATYKVYRAGALVGSTGEMSAGIAALDVHYWTVEFIDTVTFGNVPANQIVKNGDTAVAQTLVRVGYDFAGWTRILSDVVYDFDTPVTAPLLLSAKLTAKTYVVEYNGNRNTGGTAPADGSATFGERFTAAANTYTKTVDRVDWRFTGWNTKADGTGMRVAEGETLTVGESLIADLEDGKIVLYAIWKDSYYTATVGDRFVGTLVSNLGSGEQTFDYKAIVVKVEASTYTVQIMEAVRGTGNYQVVDFQTCVQGMWPDFFEVGAPAGDPLSTGTMDFDMDGRQQTMAVKEYNIMGTIVKINDEEFPLYARLAFGNMSTELTLTGFISAANAGYRGQSYNITYQSDMGVTAGQVTISSNHYATLAEVGFTAPEGMRFAGWYYVMPEEMSQYLTEKNNDYQTYIEMVEMALPKFEPSYATMGDITLFALWTPVVIENTNINWTLTNMPEWITMTINGQPALDNNAVQDGTIVFNGGFGWEYDSETGIFSFVNEGEEWYALVRSANVGDFVDGHMVVRTTVSSMLKYDVNVVFFREQPLYAGYAPTVGDTFTVNGGRDTGVYRVTSIDNGGYYIYDRPNEAGIGLIADVGEYPQFNIIPELSVVGNGTWTFKNAQVPCYILTNSIYTQSNGNSNTNVTKTYVGVNDGLVYAITSNGNTTQELTDKSLSLGPQPTILVNIIVDEHAYLRIPNLTSGEYGQDFTILTNSLAGIQIIGQGSAYTVLGLSLTPGGEVRYGMGEDDLIAESDWYIHPEDVIDGELTLYVKIYSPGSNIRINGNGGANDLGDAYAEFFQIYKGSSGSDTVIYPDIYGFVKGGQAAYGFSIPNVEGVKLSLTVQSISSDAYMNSYVSLGIAVNIGDGAYYSATLNTLYVVKENTFAINFVYGESGTITYNPAGGVGSERTFAAPLVDGSYIYLVENFYTKNGYKFMGWTPTDDNSVIFEDDAIYSDLREYFVSGQLTLFAVWAPVFTAQFDTSHPAFCGSVVAPMDLVCDGVTPNRLPTPVTGNGDLLGWKLTTVSGDVIYTLYGTNAYTFDPSYSMQTVTFQPVIVEDAYDLPRITLNKNYSGVNSSSMPSTMRVPAGALVQLPQVTVSLENAIFRGWSTSASGAVEYANGGLYTMPAEGDVTLYAVWTFAKQVVILFDNEHYERYYTYQNTVSLPSGPTFDTDYVLMGWYYYRSQYDDSPVFCEKGATVDISSAQSGFWFEAVWGVTINFNVNSESSTITGSMDSVVIRKGEYYQLPGITFRDSANAVMPVGWGFEPGTAVGEHYEVGYETYVGDDGVVNLYVVWDTCTRIIFNANGGSGTMPDQYVHTNCAIIELSSPGFRSPSGKDFEGWATTQNGEDADWYYPGTAYEWPSTEVTLYAQWYDL